MRAEAVFGRDQELAGLVELVAASRGRGGRIAVVEGESGIGKTTLIAALCESVDGRGVDVLAGAAHELEARRPFSVLRKALGITRDARDPGCVRIAEMLAGDGEEVAAMIEARVSEAIVSLIDERCARRPLVLVLEDLHWADPASVVTIHMLLREIDLLSLALVCTYRPASANREARRLLAELAAAGASRLRLGGLDRAAIEQLAHEQLGHAPGPRLMELLDGAGGNPFYARELLVALQRADALTVESDVAEARSVSAIPALSVAILDRVAPLTPSMLEILRLASVLGSGFSASDLATVAGRPAFEIAPALEDAVRSQLLDERGTMLVFRHDLVRRALYEDIPESVRAGLHRDAGRALAAAGADARLVAEHLGRSAVRGDKEAISWLQRAADEIAPRSPLAAVDLLERALELVDPIGTERERLLPDIGVALIAAGRHADGERVCREVLAGHHASHDEERLHVALVDMFLTTGRLADAHKEAQIATTAPGLSETARLRMSAVSALTRVFVGDLDGAREAALTVQALARDCNDLAALARALTTEAFVDHAQGHIVTAVRRAQEASDVAHRSATREAHRGLPDLHLAAMLSDVDRLDESWEVFERARAIAEGYGMRGSMPAMYFSRAHSLFVAGRWDDALAEIETGREISREQSATWAPPALGLAATIAVHRDERPLAEDSMKQAGELLAAGAPPFRLSWLLRAGAMLQRTDGDDQAALDMLAGYWDAAVGAGSPTEASGVATPLIEAAIAVGEHDRAAVVVSTLDELVERNPAMASIRGMALRCRGLVDDDAATLLEAVDAYAAGTKPFELALTREDAAAAVARDGDADRAAELLDAALETFASVGAVRDAARAEARLRSAGLRRGRRGTRKRAETGWRR